MTINFHSNEAILQVARQHPNTRLLVGRTPHGEMDHPLSAMGEPLDLYGETTCNQGRAPWLRWWPACLQFRSSYARIARLKRSGVV
jgi:hypothetical protein